MHLKRAFLPFIISILFFVLYLTQIPSVNVGYADSDLFMSVGYYFGVAHPPGYQLYSLLLFLFTHLPFSATIAFKAHVLSAILHSLTLGITFATIHLLLSQLNKNRVGQNIIMSFLSTVALGTSYLFWLYSTIAEKYPLNNLFAAIIIYFGLYGIVQKKIARKIWFQLGIAIGLALTHHQTSILILPFLAYTIFKPKNSFKENRKTILVALSFTLIASWLILFVANDRQVPVSWHFRPSLQGFVRELTRQELAGYLADRNDYRSLYLMNVTPQQIFNQIPVAIQQLTDHFGLIVMGIYALGMVYLVQNRHQPYAKSLLILTASTTLFIPLYLPWPTELARQAIIQRQFLLGYIPIPLILSLGFLKLIQYIQRIDQKITPVFLTIFCLLLLYRGITNYPQTNLKNFTLIHEKYQTMINSLPINSVLFCQSDISCFALLYEQKVNNLRADVLVIPSAYVFVKNELNAAHISPLSYSQKPLLLLNYLAWSIPTRPVYITDLQKSYYDMLGFASENLIYTSHEYAGKISYTVSKGQSNTYNLTNKLAGTAFPPKDYMRQQLVAATLQTHLLNARMYTHQNNPSAAEAEIAYARTLAAKLPPLYQQGVTDFTRQLQHLSVEKPTPLNSALSNFVRNPIDLVVHQQLYQALRAAGLGEAAQEEQANITLLTSSPTKTNTPPPPHQ